MLLTRECLGGPGHLRRIRAHINTANDPVLVKDGASVGLGIVVQL